MSGVSDVGMSNGDTARSGDWMEVRSGGQFYPLDPRVDEVRFDDIAHSLARLCRYNGHVRVWHYSVAEHSCELADWLLKEYKDPVLAMQGLLQDATEAYVGDMVRPLKRHQPDFVAAEGAVWLPIANKFGLPAELDERVHEADNRILVNERTDIMNPSDNDWGIDGLEPLDLGHKLEGMSAERACRRFYQTRQQLLNLMGLA